MHYYNKYGKSNLNNEVLQLCKIRLTFRTGNLSKWQCMHPPESHIDGIRRKAWRYQRCRNAKPCVFVSRVLTSRYLSGICTYSLVVLTALKNYKINSTATCRHHLIVKSFHWIQINVDLSELQHAEISVEGQWQDRRRTNGQN